MKRIAWVFVLAACGGSDSTAFVSSDGVHCWYCPGCEAPAAAPEASRCGHDIFCQGRCAARCATDPSCGAEGSCDETLGVCVRRPLPMRTRR